MIILKYNQLRKVTYSIHYTLYCTTPAPGPVEHGYFPINYLSSEKPRYRKEYCIYNF